MPGLQARAMLAHALAKTSSERAANGLPACKEEGHEGWAASPRRCHCIKPSAVPLALLPTPPLLLFPPPALWLGAVNWLWLPQSAEEREAAYISGTEAAPWP